MILPKETVQKGGVLFEDIGAAQINGEFMMYKSVADTSILQTAAQTATYLTTLYSSFCEGINNDLKRAAINQMPINQMPSQRGRASMYKHEHKTI
jgi:hypothetical protein